MKNSIREFFEEIRKLDRIQKIYILIFGCTPIIDSLNGFLLKSGISGGLSIGKIYRLITIIFIAVIWIKNTPSWSNVKKIIIIALGLSVTVIIQLVFGITKGSIVSETMNIAQWIMMPIIFFSFIDIKDKEVIGINCIYKIMDIWRVVTPLTIVVPYILGIGYATYHDTGYKAFYYSTNAITYFLIILFLFDMGELIKNVTKFNIIKTVLTAFSLIMLGTKSGYAFMIAIILGTAFLKYRKDFKKGISRILIISVIMLLVVIVLIKLFPEQFTKIFSRHLYFLQQSDSFLSFITTRRSDRIPVYFSYIQHSGNYVLRVLFGSGYTLANKLGAIEMDYFDALFMFGVFGISIIIWNTIYIFKNRNKLKNDLVLVAYFITIIFSMLGGHIWSNSLSSTCFAIVCCMLVSERKVIPICVDN